MKTFYTFISRFLLVVFTSSCLLPSPSWAQRTGGTRGGAGKTQQQQQRRADMQAFLEQARSGNREALLKDNIPAQRDGVLASDQARHADWVKNELIPTSNKQVNLYEKVQQQVIPDVAKAMNAYNKASGKKAIAEALEDMHLAAINLAAEQKKLFPTANLVVQMEKTGVVPEQLRIPFTHDGGEFLDNLPQYMTADSELNFARLLEVADPVIYPNTHRQSMAYAAQIIAQTAEAWEQFPQNDVALDLLLRAQLRLMRQLGKKTSPRKTPKAENTVPNQISSLSVNLNNIGPQYMTSLSPKLSRAPQDAADANMRGWFRLALLHIHHLYKVWGVSDPVGINPEELKQDFFDEIAVLRSKKLRETEKSFAAFVSTGTLAALYSLRKGDDVAEIVRAMDDNPDSHLTKQTKLKTPYVTAVQAVVAVLTDQIRYEPTKERASRLGNMLVRLTDEKKYSIGVRLAALESLGKLRAEQDATDFKCKQSKLAKEQYLSAGCYKLEFTPEMLNYLAIKVLDIYWPLNATHYASIRDYGLDSSEMQALAEQLVLLYNRFAADPIFGSVLSERTDIYGQKYLDGSYLVVVAPDGFLRNVNDGGDGFYYTLKGNERFDKQEVKRTYRVYGAHQNPINEKKLGDEQGSEFVKLVGEAVLWTVAFEAIAVVLRTLRGVCLGLPKAAKSLKEGATLAQAGKEIRKGVQLSNAIAATSEAGISVQVLEAGAENPTLVKNYRALTNLGKKEIAQLNVFYGSEHMASLSTEGILGLKSVPKLDTWEFITKNLVAPGTNVPIGLKALEGPMSVWFNPVLGQVANEVNMRDAVGYMTKAGKLDLWVGTRPSGEGVAGADKVWVNLRDSQFQGLELDRIFAKGNNVQFAVTPTGAVPSQTLMPTLGKAGTPFESALQPYVPMTRSEFMDLAQEFFGNPRAFGIREPSALRGFKELQAIYAENNAGRQLLSNGLWRQNAAKLWSQAGQADMLYTNFLRSNIPFLEFEMNLAFWAGLKMADEGVYNSGYGDWLTRTAGKAQNKEMEERYPEYSAAQKEAAKNRKETVDDGDIMQSVSAATKPDTDGALFSAPIVALRYGLGANIFALPDATKDLLQTAENNTRLGNAAGFAQVYVPLQESITEVKGLGAQSAELGALGTKYEKQSQYLKMSSAPYNEKLQDILQLQDNWAYDVLQWSAEKTVSDFAELSALTPAEVKAYQRQINEIVGSNLDKGQKNLRLSALREEVAEKGNYNLYTKVAVERMAAQVVPIFGEKNFEDIFANYERKMVALKNNKEATDEDFRRIYEEYLIKAVDDRIVKLQNDPKWLRQFEVEQSVYQEDLAY